MSSEKKILLKYLPEQKVFACKTSFEDRHIPREAGFQFDNYKGYFYTKNYNVAARLAEYATDSAQKKIYSKILKVIPWAGELPYPPKEKPFPHQLEAAKFSLSRNRSYLALDPGLGKTPTAIMVANALASVSTETDFWFYVYVCPPFLTATVKEEFLRWRTFDSMVAVYNPAAPYIPNACEFVIMPDSVIRIEKHAQELKEYICLSKTMGAKICFIIDEAHRFNNAESARSEALFGYIDFKEKKRHRGFLDYADKIIYMSGTPMPNARPMELYNTVRHSAPESINFMDRFSFGVKFCAGFETNFGWDFNGVSNFEEFTGKLKEKFMLRFKKSILNLPPKLEELLVVSGDMSAKLTAMNAHMVKAVEGERENLETLLRQKRFEEAGKDGELHTSTYRRLLGMEKVPFTVEVVKEILDNSNEAILLFAEHRDVIAKLVTYFSKYNPCVIVGDTAHGIRHEKVKEFQDKSGPRLFILQISAGGVGLTLTRATRVIIMEPSWVPGINDQASDRAHRIGQGESVLVQYIVFKNSLDKEVCETFLRKRKYNEKL